MKPGTVALTALPDPKNTQDLALAFQDWMEVSSSVMADISEGSSEWWKGVVRLVETTYEKWLSSSALEKLGVEPKGTSEWCEGRWTRVNARASSMILVSMSEDLRAEMVSRRFTKDCVKMIFRLYTYFQPGGSDERQDMLRRLQSPVDFLKVDTARRGSTDSQGMAAMVGEMQECADDSTGPFSSGQRSP